MWADDCLFRGRDFLEMNFPRMLCDPSSFAALRCRSYKKILKRNGSVIMTPRELEQEFHKECLLMAEANERKKKKRNPVRVASLKVAGVF